MEIILNQELLPIQIERKTLWELPQLPEHETEYISFDDNISIVKCTSESVIKYIRLYDYTHHFTSSLVMNGIIYFVASKLINKKLQIICLMYNRDLEQIDMFESGELELKKYEPITRIIMKHLCVIFMYGYSIKITHLTACIIDEDKINITDTLYLYKGEVFDLCGGKFTLYDDGFGSNGGNYIITDEKIVKIFTEYPYFIYIKKDKIEERTRSMEETLTLQQKDWTCYSSSRMIIRNNYD